MSFATPDATKSCHEDFPQLTYNELGKTGLYISEAGIGTYRMSNQNPDHVNAMRRALLYGINLIDTSSNYMDGDAERLIGESLRVNSIDRETVVIVSKGGYLPKNLATQDQLNSESFTSLDDKMGHCLDPDFIKSQLQQSLDRLSIDCIDVYLIHNPEYYLKHLLETEDNELIAKDRFYRQVQALFELLETEVKNGNIQYYGISANTLPHTTAIDSINVDYCVEIASKITKDHHFAVCQFPFNLCENEAARSIDGKEPLLDQLKRHGIGSLSNRPFNSIFGGEFVSLKNVIVEKEIHSLGDLEELFQRSSQIEDQINKEIIQNVIEDEAEQKKLYETIAMTGVLYGMMDDRHNYDTFRDALLHYGLPKVEIGINQLAPYIEDNLDHKKQCIGYYSTVNRCFEGLSHYYKTKKEPIVQKLKENIFSLIELSPHTSLPSMAFSTLRETSNLDAILVGMRHESYVEHILEECEKNRYFDCEQPFWEALDKKNKKILTN